MTRPIALHRRRSRERYASRGDARLWSPRRATASGAQLWLALAEAEQELGVAGFPTRRSRRCARTSTTSTSTAVAAYERRFRHDVMAHVHAFGDVAPAARPFIHLGATSAFVTDNADLILMRRGLELLRGRSSRCCARWRRSRAQWRDEPTLGYTHLQPAQLTTVGKRATLWMQDLVLDLDGPRLSASRRCRFRGVKGTTGTQASFLELFDGDHDAVRELERRVTARDGLHARRCRSPGRRTRASSTRRCSASSPASRRQRGEVRERHAHAAGVRRDRGAVRGGADRIVGDGVQAQPDARRAHRLARALRRLARAEREQTHGVQYFERTLDDSANRRLVIPEIVSRGRRDPHAHGEHRERPRGTPGAHPAARARRAAVHGHRGADRAAVRAGGDRQAAHEVSGATASRLRAR